MSIRPNPSGQDKNISWGHLGNFRKYKNVASKDDKEKTLEERKREIFEKMKPYNSEDYIDKALFVVGGAGVYDTPSPTPSPTPTPTQTITPTPTNTPTQSITPTITPTPSITPSITPTTSVTPTLTPTPTPSPVPTFDFVVNTAIAGTSGVGNFQLPLVSSLSLNAVVDWGDGNTDTITTFNQAETLHTYSSGGTYNIKITGSLSGWQFNNGGDRLKMGNINSWGALNISVASGFYGCSNMTCSATDAPTISTTSLVTYFRGCSNFNGAIGNWDISSVTTLLTMFLGCTNFNQDISGWDTSNVTTMENMFIGCTNFNQPIGSWELSANTRTVAMFSGAAAFNQPLSGWNVSNVVSMNSMFNNATAFNQDIGNWDISEVVNFVNFMNGKTNLNYSASNLDSIYNGWSSLPSVQPNITITFGTIKYTAAGQAGKDILLDPPNNWTITDGGI